MGDLSMTYLPGRGHCVHTVGTDARYRNDDHHELSSAPHASPCDSLIALASPPPRQILRLGMIFFSQLLRSTRAWPHLRKPPAMIGAQRGAKTWSSVAPMCPNLEHLGDSRGPLLAGCATIRVSDLRLRSRSSVCNADHVVCRFITFLKRGWRQCANCHGSAVWVGDCAM